MNLAVASSRKRTKRAVKRFSGHYHFPLPRPWYTRRDTPLWILDDTPPLPPFGGIHLKVGGTLPNLPDAIVRFHRIRMELDAESDRGAALVAGAYVDSWLEKAIKCRLTDAKLPKKEALFQRLFGESANPPLGSFSARIDLAFAMRLIGQHSYHDLGIIRWVRNRFAHRLDLDNPQKSLSFTEQKIEVQCNNLWFPKNYIHMVQPHLAKWMSEKAHLDTARGQYIYAIFEISHLVDIMIQQSVHVAKCIEDMTRDGKVPCILPGSLV